MNTIKIKQNPQQMRLYKTKRINKKQKTTKKVDKKAIQKLKKRRIQKKKKFKTMEIKRLSLIDRGHANKSLQQQNLNLQKIEVFLILILDLSQKKTFLKHINKRILFFQKKIQPHYLLQVKKKLKEIKL